MERSTRSGKTFAQWDGPTIVSPNTHFDFPQLVRQATALEDALCDAMEEEDYPPLPLSGEDMPPSGEDTDTEPEIIEHSAKQTRTALLQSQDRLQTAQVPKFYPNCNHAETTEIEVEETAHQRRKRKKRAREHHARSKKKQKDDTFPYHATRSSVQDKYIKTAVPIVSVQNLAEANVASTGWVGLDDRVRDEHEYTLDDLIGPSSTLKFEYVPWTGEKPIPIISREGILTAVLAGKPDAPDWDQLAAEAVNLLKDADNRCRVPDSARRHRRGAFVALQCGVSHGGGQTQPSNLRSGSRANAKILRKLNKSEPFRRLAGFSTCKVLLVITDNVFSDHITAVMAHWAPDLYLYYVNHLKALHDEYPSLQRIFPSSVFAASTYNLGPRTVCFKHTDFANLPFGWCSVTAFGDYDSTKGGHLILWDCHLVIEFPPGTTILLPSATVTHSNVPISDHETRFSYAQYTAGALFRWVENGFQKATDFVASLSEKELAEKIEKDQNRWAFGLSLLPRFEIPSPSAPDL